METHNIIASLRPCRVILPLIGDCLFNSPFMSFLAWDGKYSFAMNVLLRILSPPLNSSVEVKKTLS